MFSLRTLFLAVAYFALVCGALLHRAPLWGSIMFTATLVIGVSAVIVAWRFPLSRDLYGPLAIVIWVYMLIVFCPLFQSLERPLITSYLIFQSYAQMSRDPLHDAKYWEEFFYMVPRNKTENRASWSGLVGLVGYYHVVHSVVAVLLGITAGLLTAWANRSRRAK